MNDPERLRRIAFCPESQGSFNNFQLAVDGGRCSLGGQSSTGVALDVGRGELADARVIECWPQMKAEARFKLDESGVPVLRIALYQIVEQRAYSNPFDRETGELAGDDLALAPLQ